MLKFLNLYPEIFGIDVNDFSLRIVKLKKHRRGFRIVSFHEQNIKPGIVQEGVIQDQTALARVIASACSLVHGKKLETVHAIVSLPEEKSFSQVIQMPVMTQEELATAVPLEVENYIPLAIDKVYMDFQVIEKHADKENNKHVDLLINVMPKTIIDSYVACFKEAGLVPYILEVESQAITRALIKRGASLPPVILIDLGSASTSFIIVSSGAIRFTSSIPVSSEQLTKAIATSLNIEMSKAENLKLTYGLSGQKSGGRTGAEASDIAAMVQAMNPLLEELASQIKKYITFYRDHVTNDFVESAGNIKNILLCGGGANLKGLPEFLSQQIGLPVEIGNPLSNIMAEKHGGSNSFPLKKALSFTTALGLALRGADQKTYD